MSTTSDKLSKALTRLSFVDAVEHEQQGSAVNVLCRIKPGCGALWASLAEKILREALKRENTSDYWHTHIARVYMIRDNRLVYGWIFILMSSNPEKTTDIVIGILNQVAQNLISKENKSQPRYQVNTVQSPVVDEEDDFQTDFPSDEDYTDAEGPLPRGAVPESDERGNPIVPRSARVRRISMAGLPKNYDRNAPDPDVRKGSWGIDSRKSKSFRPPVRN